LIAFAHRVRSHFPHGTINPVLTSSTHTPCHPKPDRVTRPKVHLTYWTPTSVLVSWATCDAANGLQVSAARSTTGASSTVRLGTAPGSLGRAATGAATSYLQDYRALDHPSYASPVLHHVLLSGEGGDDGVGRAGKGGGGQGGGG
jgi:hypothetical protein